MIIVLDQERMCLRFWRLIMAPGFVLLFLTTVAFSQAAQRFRSVPDVKPVFVFGNVKSPRTLVVTGDVRLSQALARAGGVAKNSSRILVSIRRGLFYKQEPIVLNLTAIEERSEDVLVKPGDIIEVSDEDGHFNQPSFLQPNRPTWDSPIEPRKTLDC